MKTKILRVHYNPDLSGGAEYDILKLIDVFAEQGIQNDLLIINKINRSYLLNIYGSKDHLTFFSLKEIKEYLLQAIIDNKYILVHLHSMPYPEVTTIFLSLNLPVYRSMHEPMMVCPGWAKFLMNSQKPCTDKPGTNCFISAYTEKCNRSRKPYNLLYSYKNTKFELDIAVHEYEKILVYSDYMMDTALGAGIPQNKLTKVPSPQNFVEVSKCTSNTSIQILFCGRLNKQKGLHLLIEAIQPLFKKYKAQLLVVGTGGDEKLFKQQVQDLCITDFVIFKGWKSRDDLFDIYSKVDFVCIPSIYPDNFPNVVAEAMVHENAVVTFDVGGTSEWFIDGEHGFKVKSKDIISLRDKIEKLIINPDLRKSMGVEARKWIYLNHSFQITFDKYKEVYGF